MAAKRRCLESPVKGAPTRTRRETAGRDRRRKTARFVLKAGMPEAFVHVLLIARNRATALVIRLQPVSFRRILFIRLSTRYQLAASSR